MTTTRRTVLALAVRSSSHLRAAAGGGGGRHTARPQLGPLSPAFVEALHDPMVTLGLGRVPSPVRSGSARPPRPGPRAWRCRPSTTSAPRGASLPVKDQGGYSTCWSFANIAAVESKLMSSDPAPDYSEDNLVGRSGYFVKRAQARYD